MNIGLKHIGFFLVLWLGLSVYFAGEEVALATYYNGLVANSHEYSATVTGGQHTYKKRRKRSGVDTYRIDYEFHDRSGVVRSGYDYVTRGEYERIESITEGKRHIRVLQSKLNANKHGTRIDWLRRGNINDMEILIATGFCLGLMAAAFVFFILMKLWEWFSSPISRVIKNWSDS